MENYPYGYCGMPCALCSRYRTEGKSRCPGCSAGGYYTQSCKVHHCCRDKALVHCGRCADFPCARLQKMGEFSDLRTDNAKIKSCNAIAVSGFDPWYRNLAARAALLDAALENYNDGRMKRFLCELFIQHDLPFLQELMRQAKPLTGERKEKAKAFRQLAEALAAASPGA